MTYHCMWPIGRSSTRMTWCWVWPVPSRSAPYSASTAASSGGSPHQRATGGWASHRRSMGRSARVMDRNEISFTAAILHASGVEDELHGTDLGLEVGEPAAPRKRPLVGQMRPFLGGPFGRPW